MKSERRHELEKNELADWLADWVARIKPYQNAVLLVLIVAAVLIAGYTWASRQSAASSAAGWARFYEVFNLSNPNPTDFDLLGEAYPDTTLAQWSKVIAADLHLNSGCDLRFVNQADANEELRKAAEGYEEVLRKADHPMLLERATFGLARALETQGNLKEAITRYEEVVTSWPEGAYQAAAKRRAEDIGRSATKEWYDRFAKFDPKPAYSNEPGTPGKKLPFDLQSLEEPDLLGEPKAGGQRKPSEPLFQPGENFGNLGIESRPPDQKPAPETPPASPESSKPDDAPKPDNAPKPDDMSKPDDATKSGDAPKADAVKKPDDATKPDDAPKADDAKKPGDAESAKSK